MPHGLTESGAFSRAYFCQIEYLSSDSDVGMLRMLCLATNKTKPSVRLETPGTFLTQQRTPAYPHFGLTHETRFVNNLSVNLALGAAGGHMHTEHEWERLYRIAEYQRQTGRRWTSTSMP